MTGKLYNSLGMRNDDLICINACYLKERWEESISVSSLMSLQAQVVQ